MSILFVGAMEMSCGNKLDKQLNEGITQCPGPDRNSQ